MKLRLPALLFLGVALVVLGADAVTGPPSTEELIRHLSSKHFRTREEAQRELLKREESAPALRRALKTADAETTRRINTILEEFARRDDRRALEPLAAHANKGEVGRVIELLVRRPSWGAEEDAAWQVFSDLAGKILDAEKKKFGKAEVEKAVVPGEPEWQRQARLPFRDFSRYKKLSLPAFVSVKPTAEDHRAIFTLFWSKEDRMNRVPPRPVTLAARTLELSRSGYFVIRGHDVHATQGCASSLFACTGQFRADGSVHHSGIFTVGPVDVKNLRNSVIVCGGDFTARESLSDCVVVASGKVTLPQIIVNCTIVAGGSVVIPKRTFPNNVAIKEKQAVPLEALGFPPKK